MDGMLSQDEINALLAQANLGDSDSTADNPADIEDTPPAANASGDNNETLTDEQKDAIGEISNISMGTAATTLSTLLNQTVNITTPQVTYLTWDDLADSYDRPCVFLQISYTAGLDGNNVLVLRERDVKIITDLMMGGEGVASDDPIGELHLSAIGEAMNQMMGSAATSMSSMLGKKIDISPPVANLVDLNESQEHDKLPAFLKTKFVKVSFRMTIGSLIDSEIMQLYPFDFAQNLYETFSQGVLGGGDSDADEELEIPEMAASPGEQAPSQGMNQQAMPQQEMPQGQPMPGYGMPQQGMPMPGYGMPQQGMPMPGYGMPMYGQPMPGYGMPQQDNVNVQPAAFQPFTGMQNIQGHENIDLIMDVPLEVTVELGRTTKSIKDILEFAPGTIVELNKIAGEPIDVLVNGKYVARGEVVVIEESFGVKITEIIK